MWVLLDHMGNFYMFEEGYLRFTSTPYRLDSASIDNNYVHLTNHSLQKYSPNYDKNHNLRPMAALRQYLIFSDKEKIFDRIIQ